MPCDDHHPAMPHVDDEITHGADGAHIVTYTCGLCGHKWQEIEADCLGCWRERA
mgnify:CR=1 FL=1